MAAVKASVLGLDGAKVREVALPEAFAETVDAALIKRAVLAAQTARLQPKGPNPRAGRDNTAKYVGARRKPAQHRTMNNELSRLPRMLNRRSLVQGRVARVPQAVGGGSVHRPLPAKTIAEKINRGERRKAVLSAIAATARIELVRQRGHRFAESVSLPLVVEDKLQELVKTKDVVAALTRLRVFDDVERAKRGKKVRAGKGKARGRKYKKPKSVLIVAGDSVRLYRAARNLPGVDVVNARNLSAELLAPGAVAGRLTVWTEGALKAL